MNRLIVLLTLFVFSSITGLSQDTIYTVNKETIISKIIEVLPQEIKYKKFDNIEGPLYTMDISIIQKIVYKNGSEDIFYKSDTIGKMKNKEEPGSYIVILFGATNTTLWGDIESAKRKIGFAGGFTIEIPINSINPSYFDLTLLYEQKGTAYKDQFMEINGTIYDVTDIYEDIDYITLATTYKGYFGKKQLFYGRIGIFAGYLYEAVAKGDFKSTVDGNVINLNTSVKDFYSKLDLGAVVGLGLTIPLDKEAHKSSLVFDFRYNVGLSNIYDKIDSSPISGDKAFTADFLFMGGIHFPL